MKEKEHIRAPLEKIAREFEKAGATNWETIKIIKQLENDPLSEKAIRKKAFGLLLESNPKAAEIFLSFQKMRVFTSKEKLEAFDRGNITKSILKETRAARTVAEKISSEVEDRLKDLVPAPLTTSLIRDMTASKLLEFGHSKTYYQYARLGMPVFDVEEKIAQKKKISSEIMRQYNWLKAIPTKAKELHFRGLVSISFPNDFSSRPQGRCIELGSGPVDISSALLEFQKILFVQNTMSSVPPSISGINLFFAPALEKKTKKEIKKTATLVIQVLDDFYSMKKNAKKGIAGLDLFVNEKTTLSARQKEKAIEFASVFAEMFSLKEHFFMPAFSIDSKYKLKLINGLAKKCIVLNCSNGPVFPFPGNIAGKKTTLCQTATINLEKFFDKKTNSFDDSVFGACRALQEAFNEKEKRTAANDATNIVLIQGILAGFEKNPSEVKNVLLEIRKQFSENTALWADEKAETISQQGNTMQEFFCLENDIQKVHSAESMDEVEEIFSKKAFMCILECK